MTLDELTDLCRALLEEAGVGSPAAFRALGGGLLTTFTDDEFLLAVRFVSGERVLNGPAERPTIEPAPRRERSVGVPLTPELLAELDAIEHEDEVPAKQVDLGDGVFLGFN